MLSHSFNFHTLLATAHYAQNMRTYRAYSVYVWYERMVQTVMSGGRQEWS